MDKVETQLFERSVAALEKMAKRALRDVLHPLGQQQAQMQMPSTNART